MPKNRYYQGPPSDHFDGERFFNPGQTPEDRGLVEILRWRLGRKVETWPRQVAARQVVPESTVPGLRITMVGHASLLIQASGRNLLVDPVWSERVSPFSFAGPRRVTPPGIAFDDLPVIDTVLLTHSHYDHCDLATLRRLSERDHPRLVAPLGNDAVVARAGGGIAVATFDWGDTADLGHGLSAELVPARHWSARTLGDRRQALWCGYLLRTPAGVVYLAGDTGYGDGAIFKDVGRRHPDIDVAILPIGAYQPRWFMKNQHVDPAEAVEIMVDCGARQALGVHWGTFPLSDEARDDPPAALAAALAARDLPAERFLAFAPGEVWEKAAA